MNAPRVLLSGVVLSQPMGGVQRHNREILPRAARLLAERGGELALLEGAGGVPFPLPEGIARIRSRVPPRPALARASLEGPSLRRVLAGAARSGRPFDLVHTAHLPAPRMLPVPYTLLLHDLRALHRVDAPASRRLLARRVIRAGARRAARVLVVSEALRQELLSVAPVAPERVLVVPNAADHFEPLPRTPVAGAPLVHVGHVERRKNLALLLHALALDPGLPRLVLAGAPKGDEDMRLRDLAAELGVSARVEFVGLLDDEALARLYAAASCAVFPSRREGFGIPALEALRARVPVAVSRTPALQETAGEQTPSFSPDDPAECARAIRAAMGTPSRVIEEASARAESFTWQSAAERLVDAWCAASGRVA